MNYNSNHSINKEKNLKRAKQTKKLAVKSQRVVSPFTANIKKLELSMAEEMKPFY